MPQRYHVVSLPDSPSALDHQRLAQVLAQDGQLLLPRLDLIENAQVAIDDLIDLMGRATIEAAERPLKELAGRRLSGLEILAIWIDGIQLGPYHVICAVGVDAAGREHVLGLREGATENAVVAKALLEDLVGRGLDPERRYL